MRLTRLRRCGEVRSDLARTTAAPGPAMSANRRMAATQASAVETLEALGVRGILRKLAQHGQIIDVRCEMPQCYCFRGRHYFAPQSPLTAWSPTADHHPRLKSHGGHLTPDNVRLAHHVCNQRDYQWRMRINAPLA